MRYQTFNIKLNNSCLNILETLRKYPALAFLDRVCNETYKLNDKVTIEKNTPVYINVIAIHFNEEYYPEPHEWRPERFGITTENDNHDFTFLPFGEGPRFCIGMLIIVHYKTILKSQQNAYITRS